MRRFIAVGLVGASLSVSSACSEPVAVVDEEVFELAPRSATLVLGDALELSYVPAPTRGGVALQVRDSSVLEVAGTRTVIGRTAGSTYAVILGATFSDSAYIVVIDSTACTPSLRIEPGTATFRVGEQAQFNVVDGCLGIRSDFVFQSSSEALAITPSGLATANAVGSAVVTARSQDDSQLIATATVQIE